MLSKLRTLKKIVLDGSDFANVASSRCKYWVVVTSTAHGSQHVPTFYKTQSIGEDLEEDLESGALGLQNRG
jgi:hypothetical protein